MKRAGQAFHGVETLPYADAGDGMLQGVVTGDRRVD
jgi:hypothetical protein